VILPVSPVFALAVLMAFPVFVSASPGLREGKETRSHTSSRYITERLNLNFHLIENSEQSDLVWHA